VSDYSLAGDSPSHDIPQLESKEPASMFNPVGSKATVCTFGLSQNLILTGHESGKVALFDVRNGDEVLNNEKAHMDTITDLQMSSDRSYFVTSSKDKTARVSCFFSQLF
jgi:translation initiation factor 3 subunit I